MNSRGTTIIEEKKEESVANGGQSFPVDIFRQKRPIVLRRLGKGQFCKQVTKIGIRLKPVGLGGFDQAEEGCAGIRSPGGSRKQPVLSAQHKWTNGVFSNIVVEFQKPGVDINNQFIPLVQAVLDRFAQKALRGDLWMIGVQPDPEPVQYRLGLQKTKPRQMAALSGFCLALFCGAVGFEAQSKRNAGRGCDKQYKHPQLFFIDQVMIEVNLACG